MLSLLTPVAAEQAGYFSARQAAGQGVSNQALVSLARRGVLRAVRRGVYLIEVGRAASRHEDLIGAYLELAGGALPWAPTAPLAVVSHASAAALLEIGTIVPGLPEITVSRRSVRERADVLVHVARFAIEDWRWLRLDDGLRLPVTTAARTIVDLARSGEESDYVERAIRRAFADAEEARGALAAAAERLYRRSASLRSRLDALVDGAWPA